jgi:PPOX class probable F420-dependent enzyme
MAGARYGLGVEPIEARARFASVPVARLATIAPDGAPQLVPVTFALLGHDTIVTAVDHKPKRTQALARLRNIGADDRVCLLADHYSDDWSELWWARADGSAGVREPRQAPGQRAAAIAALAARYPPYRKRPPAGALIVIEVHRWSGWSAG